MSVTAGAEELDTADPKRGILLPGVPAAGRPTAVTADPQHPAGNRGGAVCAD
ncbi:hypothetical protein [Streptomyces altiplanensis]